MPEKNKIEISETEQVMMSGKQTRFWQIIERYVDGWIEHYTEQILNGETMSFDDEKAAKNKLAVWRLMRVVPDKIVEREQASKGSEIPETYEGDNEYFNGKK